MNDYTHWPQERITPKFENGKSCWARREENVDEKKLPSFIRVNQ